MALAGDILTASRYTTDVTNIVGGARRVTSSSAIAGTETVILTTPTLTLETGQDYLALLYVSWDPSATGNSFFLRIRETGVGGTMRDIVTTPQTDAVTGYSQMAAWAWTAASTSLVLVGTAQRSVGAGTLTAKPNSHLIVIRAGGSTLATI
jgi:hypothetical protein